MTVYTIYNFISNKLFFALLVFVAVATALPLPAQAQSVTDLQAEIDELLRDINSITTNFNQNNTETPLNLGISTNSVCPFTWTRNLTLDVEGNDVFKLQQFLNASADTQIASSGVGSPGLETSYYGFLTAAAVSKFQAKYKSEILTPNDLTAPTAFFGPSTRNKMNALCTVNAEAGVSKTKVSPSSVKSSPLSGSPSLEDFDASSGSNTNLKEGQNNVRIMNAEFTVEDGDVMLNRIEAVFEYIDGDEKDPWDIFDDVSLWVEGERVSSVEADDEDEWNDDSPFNGAHTVRFSGLDIRVDEDETLDFYLTVSTQDDIRRIGDGLSWEIFIPDRGIRALDSDNAPNYIGDESDEVDIRIK